jgi:hypothetical protein
MLLIIARGTSAMPLIALTPKNKQRLKLIMINILTLSISGRSHSDSQITVLMPSAQNLVGVTLLFAGRDLYLIVRRLVVNAPTTLCYRRNKNYDLSPVGPIYMHAISFHHLQNLAVADSPFRNDRAIDTQGRENQRPIYDSSIVNKCGPLIHKNTYSANFVGC